MKTKRLFDEFDAPKHRQDGSITVVFVALMVIMMILVVAESRALIHLRREVKFMEQQQIKRLDMPATRKAATSPAESR